MYCPKCSQQQVSDEIRFCPRCGFQLETVKMLLAENQNNLAVTKAKPQSHISATRKRDFLLGATIMLVGAIFIALLMVSTIAGTPLQAVIIPLVLVWAAIVAIILLSGHTIREVTKLFSKDSSSQPPESASLITHVTAAARHQALPPVQSAPVSEFGSWRIKTAELVQPLSVTEHTTNLLDEKGE
jgi:type IV secretory pathway VirB3-like protein